MHLLGKSQLVKTGPLDHGDWNYRPILGAIIRQRFHLALALLSAERTPRLLEIGYGSGMFLPELAQRADELYGIDIHPHREAVAAALRAAGVRARLVRGSATELPFDDRYFDCLLAMSVLEFIPDIDSACREMRRVLQPQGVLVVVTPGHSVILDWGLELLTRQSPRDDYGDRRRGVAPALLKCFRVEEHRRFPSHCPEAVTLYHAYKLRPRPADSFGAR